MGACVVFAITKNKLKMKKEEQSTWFNARAVFHKPRADIYAEDERLLNYKKQFNNVSGNGFLFVDRKTFIISK